MQIILNKKEKSYMEFEFDEESETLLIPLRNQLLFDNTVEYANYNINHPTLDRPQFYLKVKSGKPQNALKKSAKALSNKYRDMLQQFQRQS